MADEETKTTKTLISKDVVLPITLVVSMIGAAFAGGVFTSDVKNSLTGMETRFDSRMALLEARVEAEVAQVKTQLLLLTTEVQKAGTDRWRGADMARWAQRLRESVEPWSSRVETQIRDLGGDAVGKIVVPEPARDGH